MSTHPNRNLLYSLSIDEHHALTRPKLLALRRSVYAEHVRQMTVRPEVQRWAATMAALHPNGAKVWDNRLSWIEALLVVRYGEDTRHWPQTFSDGDVARAQSWLEQEKIPTGLSPAGDGYGLVTVACALIGSLGLVLAILHDSGMGTLFLPFLFGTAMTDYLENKLADHLFRTTTYTQPATLASALVAVRGAASRRAVRLSLTALLRVR